LKYKDIYIDALLKEINYFYKDINLLKTIYFGGGTPSLLDLSDIEKILKQFNYNENTEITIEINPYKMELEYLKGLKSLGINRISVGVQSFDDSILNEIGRLHNYSDIIKTIENVNMTAFSNFSIDLIYGLPNQDINNWIKTLDNALLIKPNHISLYGLKIEKGSYYSKFPPKNIVDNDTQAKMYEIALTKLKDNYIHYEVSNFADSEKHFSKHNLSYWNRVFYFGFGLSASGYVIEKGQEKRYTNTYNFKNYIKEPIDRNYETISKIQALEEEIFLGLRKLEGINLKKINKRYNVDIYQIYKQKFEKYIELGFMEKTQDGIKFNSKGILVQNEILCDFIEI